jgi:fermentation-respiration switch protein FrsA (DUF1100 family)
MSEDDQMLRADSPKSTTASQPRRVRWTRNALVALLIVVVVLATPAARTALASTGFFVEVFPNAPVYPMRWLTPEPSVARIVFPIGEAVMAGDLYRPAGDGPHGAIVFYIGVGPEHENPDLIRISNAFARAGIVVLIPISPNLSEFRVEPGEDEGAVAAFQFLQAQPFVDPERVGFFGLSVGGSIAAIAAQDPRIADDVRVVDSFGGYYSAFDMLSALVLRQIEVDGEWQDWTPASVSIRVFRDTLLVLLPVEDRAPLAPLFEGETTIIPAGLSPDGDRAAALLVNRDPERMPELMADLPPAWRDHLAAISPATNVGRLRADLLLMHDRRDNIVPFTESARFYAEAERAGDRHLTLLNLFRHVSPGIDNPIRETVEGVRLYRHIYQLLDRLR